jgi:Copper type II ascorbate-dependent monooxygenase, C-terminal domain
MSRLLSVQGNGLARLSVLALVVASAACGDSSDSPADAGAPCVPGLSCGSTSFDGGGTGGSLFDGATPVLPGNDAGAGGGAASSTGLPCDVQAVVSKYCGTCHGATPQFGATVPLASYADFQANAVSAAGQKRYQLAHTRLNETTPSLRMPPTSQPQPSAQELAVLDTWLQAGAPQGTSSCGGGTGGGTAAPDGGAATPDAGTNTDGLDCYKFLAHAPNDKNSKYQVGTASDAYYNFSFKKPWTGDAYGIVIRPIIDNAKVLHHWLLFQTTGAVQDGAVSGSSGVHPDGELVHGWAPGGNALDFRTNGDVGFELPSSGGFVVEFHYNSNDASAVDASGGEVCVQKNKPANIAGVSWLGRDFFGGRTGVRTVTSTCTPQSRQRIHIVGVSPHMHTKGIHMKGVINRAAGGQETLHDAPFSFNDQTWYQKDVWLEAGDTVTTTCTWSEPAVWGQATSDEMCYLFTVAYPKNALSDGGFQGTLTHGGGACLGQ